VAEQWRTAGALLRASAKGALQAVEYWSLVGTSQLVFTIKVVKII